MKTYLTDIISSELKLILRSNLIGKKLTDQTKHDIICLMNGYFNKIKFDNQFDINIHHYISLDIKPPGVITPNNFFTALMLMGHYYPPAIDNDNFFEREFDYLTWSDGNIISTRKSVEQVRSERIDKILGSRFK
jgi:hypothetical protein